MTPPGGRFDPLSRIVAGCDFLLDLSVGQKQQLAAKDILNVPRCSVSSEAPDCSGFFEFADCFTNVALVKTQESGQPVSAGPARPTVVGQRSPDNSGRRGNFFEAQGQDHPITGPETFNETGPGCVELTEIDAVPQSRLDGSGDLGIGKLKAG